MNERMPMFEPGHPALPDPEMMDAEIAAGAAEAGTDGSEDAIVPPLETPEEMEGWDQNKAA